MGVGRSLNPDPNSKLGGAHFVSIHRTHGVPAGTSIITRQLSQSPSSERTETPGGNSVIRQHTLVGDSLNNEQRSDDLSDPPSH